MPQASEELRDRIKARFGSIDLHGPMMFLREAGYILTDEWEWVAPRGVAGGVNAMSNEEYDCFEFLCEEWDFGGLAE